MEGILKTALLGDFFDGQARVQEQVGGVGEALPGKLEQWCWLARLPADFAEVLLAQPRRTGQIGQEQRPLVFPRDELLHLFQTPIHARLLLTPRFTQ